MASLGAMLALVDGGLNREVRWAASVSGGSIANAFVLTRCAFRDVDPQEFDALVRDAIDRVERRSLLGTNGAKLRAGAAVTAIASCGIAAVHQILLARKAGHRRRVLAAAKALAYLAPAVPLVRSRGMLVERSIEEVWLTDQDGEPFELVGPRVSQKLGYTIEERYAGLSARDVPTEHVFAATDLYRGEPIYITPSLVVSDGQGVPLDRIRLALAVRASASFPGALPPARISLDRYVQRPPSYGARHDVLAVDGGVFNNLASDWRDPRERGDSDWIFTPLSLSIPVQRHLVVDAGAKLRASSRLLHEVPVTGFIYGLWRTAMVMYEAGLRGRRDAFFESLSRGSAPTTSTSLIVGTTLGRLSREQALSLVAIGYLQTIAALVEAGEDRKRFGGAWKRWLLDEVQETIPATREHAARSTRRIPGGSLGRVVDPDLECEVVGRRAGQRDADC